MPPMLAALAASLLLAGCASTSDQYPSLRIRDSERVQGTLEPASAAPVADPTPAPADLPGKLAAMLAGARSAHAEFTAALPGAQRSVAAARGASTESNAWAAAQVALADLDSARSKTAIALADLDLLYADATLEYTERTAIDAARDEVIGLVDDEDQALDRLRRLI
ncbi:MAG: hypothetical protein IE933_01950 [Sphingomonadales bacterium]|nr:hypothetical protein [Sphingomonadales bacterium]MBD3773391.1 hypothetical protein [Paracoccaceae bacterium]